jgi:hypothetical protein
MQELALIIAGLDFISKLLPRVDEAVKNGQVSVEAQAELRQRYNELRAKADAAFEGPEWKVE